MISVVIPCYNAGSFINETLSSILSQNSKHLREIILIDDGSTDDTKEIVAAYHSDTIQYIYQKNGGVSKARNHGLSLATGKYVVFFDADDVMGEGFIASRLEALEQNPDYGFACGFVRTFPDEEKEIQGIVKDPAREILHYLPRASCPSNYMFRLSTLKQHHLCFNEELSSTADRFFLLEISSVTQGILVSTGHLYYRVTPDSMSNKISRKLINDNEHYSILIRKNKLAPKHLQPYFHFRISYILGAGFCRTGNYGKGVLYGLKTIFYFRMKYLSTDRACF